jgi:two-component system, sensor histidine kinase
MTDEGASIEAKEVRDARESLEAVRREQLRMIWAHSRGGLIAATLFAGALALYANGRVDTEWVLMWLVAKVVVAGARIVQSVAYQHAGQPGDRRWRQSTYRMLALDGMVWGLAGLFMVRLSPEAANLISACLVGVTCVATFGLQARALATACYVGPIMTMTALGLLSRLDGQGLIGGFGLMAVLAIQLRTAAQSERRFAELHELRLRADALAAQRRDALELAQRESAAKSQFMSNVSHELRTPLQGVMGLGRMLHSHVNTPQLKREVELLQSSGAHLLRLVNDLIDIGSAHSHKLVLRPRRFDLVYELESLLAIYAVRAEDKSLGYARFVRIVGPCWVNGDSARMRQILHNVLGNAIKYTPVHGTVTVAAYYIADALKVEVRDTGPGLSTLEQEAVFGAFMRVGDSVEGAGLGLTIAREVARAMGGDIELQSAGGVGSLFTINLPLESAQAGVSERYDTEVIAARPIGPKRVLVVEDDDVSAMIAEAALNNLGLNVERVANGADAVRHALRETDRPDLVLMDCRVPVMSGYDAAKTIRAQELAMGMARVPIVACTANESSTLKSECLEAGMDDLLKKPWESAELYAVINRWVGVEAPAKRPTAWSTDA